MSKKIVVLNGSPRGQGNTKALINAFMEGAKAAGHVVTNFDLQRMNINPCLGCGQGGKNIDSPCVQKDDMDKIYAAYRDADLVCLASPMYYWAVSGQLKCAFDRLFAVAECNEDLSNPKKEAVLLMAAEGSDFAEVEYWYDRTLKHLDWIDLGKVLCGGVYEVGAIEGNPKLDEAYNLGNNL